MAVGKVMGVVTLVGVSPGARVKEVGTTHLPLFLQPVLIQPKMGIEIKNNYYERMMQIVMKADDNSSGDNNDKKGVI